MASFEELQQARKQKLDLLITGGVNPYPASSKRDTRIVDIGAQFASLEKEQKTITIAGRILSLRGQGAIIFANITDGGAIFQLLFKRDVLGDEVLSFFESTIDIGDFIDATGTVFLTKTNQQTLQVSSWQMLTKSLAPLPEKWHGLENYEERFRKRYLDLLLNPEERELFIKKAKFWEVTRTFLKERGFLEVETPTLEITTGGAEARPFKTHHNDFDLDVYMRISVGELWQKRLMAAGFERTFEIGRAYRNEGSSPEHVQEFTNMEFYAAYMNLDEGKKMVRDLYIKIGKEVFGKTIFETRGHTFDLESEWAEIDYAQEIENRTGIDIFSATEDEMIAKLTSLGVTYEGKNRERLTDSLWKYCRKQISGPIYLINHPKLVAPLSKTNPLDPRKTEMFQVIIGGSEIGRAHAELNDPIDQRERFEKQQTLVTEGDEEAMMADYDYVEMLEHGMPPTFGFGFGERFFSFLADKPIRETQLFPLMKPKEK
ncbi:lysine--tRNA ligase [Candidatus Nomurabacteria bacterium]|jgi:lysyl-tRNA synthetase class 2|nr:MAG: lysine--tRNA ligase [Candidatus Nomurabacteria bacterium]